MRDLEVTFDQFLNFDDHITAICSQVPCILQAFWGVSIKDVYDEAYQHWQAFHQQFMCDILFKEISLVMGDKVFIDCCINKTFE